MTSDGFQFSPMTPDRAFLESQISLQRVNMWISFGFSLSLVLVGILVTMWCFKSTTFSSLVDSMKVGPALFSSAVAALPLKAFLSYRVRLAMYRYLQGCPESDPLTAQLIMKAKENLLKVE